MLTSSLPGILLDRVTGTTVPVFDAVTLSRICWKRVAFTPQTYPIRMHILNCFRKDFLRVCGNVCITGNYEGRKLVPRQGLEPWTN